LASSIFATAKVHFTWTETYESAKKQDLSEVAKDINLYGRSR